MRRATIPTIVLLATVILGCGPRETPEQHLQRIRNAHEITPLGYTTIHGEDGAPVTVVDLRIVDRSDEALQHLTVMVRLVGPDGRIKAEKRATLDLDGARPGVGIQTAARIPGMEAGPDDQIQVELETAVPDDLLHTFPEWKDLASGNVS